MAGIGIRYAELASRLSAAGFDVRLLNPGPVGEVPPMEGVEVVAFERGHLRQLLAGCDVAITQGQLANDLLLEVPDLPTVVDLYDPFLIENMHYLSRLGLDPYRNDHATWVLQLSRGDFFLCSSEEQRAYYLGFLTALGRVHPPGVEKDPDLRCLIDVVPFGVSADLPTYERLLPPRAKGEKRLLFGGLYDWYDPWPVLAAFNELQEQGWKLLFIRNPNPGSTPQDLFTQVENWCQSHRMGEDRVQFLDWIPSTRRYDLLREVDLMVATHLPSLETRLSLRTRFLDALVAGCPVLTSEGGAMSRMLKESDAGWVVPTDDASAVATAMQEILAGGAQVEARRQRGRQLAASFRWEKVLEPLLRFCHKPKKDRQKEDFTFRPPTLAPPDSLLFRLSRWWSSRSFSRRAD
jgi:glycosyltransferase involved in cell wall biosynthesis